VADRDQSGAEALPKRPHAAPQKRAFLVRAYLTCGDDLKNAPAVLADVRELTEEQYGKRALPNGRATFAGKMASL
jgi:hypothetical protein